MSAPKKESTSKLDAYLKLSKSIISKPVEYTERAVGVTMALGVLGAFQTMDAQTVYSGTQNVACNLAANSNRCYANLDLAGGNDFEIHRNLFAGHNFIQADEVLGGGLTPDGFLGNQVGAYAYPYALNSGAVIGPAGPWAFGAGQGNTVQVDGGPYPNPHWGLPNGTTRFFGFRTAGPRYGWIRITVNSFANFTLVDWAYNTTVNLPIIAGQIATAANVSFSGRVLTPEGRGLPNAIVKLTVTGGQTKTVRTSPFGYFKFEDIEAGSTVVVSVESKSYQYNSQVYNVNDDVAGIDFIPAGN